MGTERSGPRGRGAFFVSAPARPGCCPFPPRLRLPNIGRAQPDDDPPLLTPHGYAEALRAEIVRGEQARMKKGVPVDELLGEFDEHFRRLRRLSNGWARDVHPPLTAETLFRPGTIVVGNRPVAVERRRLRAA
jgi:hypothetical protein